MTQPPEQTMKNYSDGVLQPGLCLNYRNTAEAEEIKNMMVGLYGVMLE